MGVLARPVRIANASAFWGDDPGALAAQVEAGGIDYVTSDYLAEITMSILAKQARGPRRIGYVGDFVDHLTPVLELVAARGIKVVTNAGGLDPEGLARALGALLRERGLGLEVAAVSGDGIADRLATWRATHSLANLEDGAPFAAIADRVVTANAYLGAAPIAAALAAGADLVVTGRTTDSALALGPLVHAHGWQWDDWDRLAAGVVAGHVLECGTQATGGNFTDWRRVESFARMGFPIVEVAADGSFVVTKAPGTGGLVDVDTVREQLVYEILEPRYLTPDVVADFAPLTVEPDGPDRVRVRGARGAPPPPDYKVSITYDDGYKATGMLLLAGLDARAKAEAIPSILWSRLGPLARRACVWVGYDATLPGRAPASEPTEVLVRVSAADRDRERITAFCRAVVALATSGPPGISLATTVPHPLEVVAHWPTLVPRELVRPRVALLAGETLREVPFTDAPPSLPAASAPATAPRPSTTHVQRGTLRAVPLAALALARSGDKGDHANIGVLARSERAYEWLCRHLTAAWVAQAFAPLCAGPVERYELPGLLALNFVLRHALDGGGTSSLRVDPQAKTFSQVLLALPVEVDQAYL